MLYDAYFIPIVVIMTALFNVFKLYNLGYVSNEFTRVNAAIVLYMLFSYFKWVIGLRANRLESWWYKITLILLCALCIILNYYFMFLQTYVMIYEAVIQGISMIFTGMEALFGLF